MKATHRAWTFWIVTIVAFATTIAMLVFYTPVEQTMGPVQKIFYLHLPVAINAFVACFIVFIASVGYLWQRTMWWDDLAAAAGKVAAIYCSIVLLTGMIWGKSAWGFWWTWSPRLTFSLVLWLLYVIYVMIRPSIESPRRRALVSAVYGIAAFVDVPLVYLSTKLIEEVHPSSITLAPAMKWTLLAWFVPITLICFGLIRGRYLLNRRARALEATRRADSEVSETTHPEGEPA